MIGIRILLRRARARRRRQRARAHAVQPARGANRTMRGSAERAGRRTRRASRARRAPARRARGRARPPRRRRRSRRPRGRARLRPAQIAACDRLLEQAAVAGGAGRAGEHVAAVAERRGDHVGPAGRDRPVGDRELRRRIVAAVDDAGPRRAEARRRPRRASASGSRARGRPARDDRAGEQRRLRLAESAAVNWIWRCRFDSSTMSGSTIVSSIPAAPSASAIGPPRPPAPTSVARIVMPRLPAHLAHAVRRRSRRRTRRRGTACGGSTRARRRSPGRGAPARPIVASSIGPRHRLVVVSRVIVIVGYRHRSVVGVGVVGRPRPRLRSSPQFGAARPQHLADAVVADHARRTRHRGTARAGPIRRRSSARLRAREQIRRRR